METKPTSGRKDLKLKLAGLYIVSLALIIFIVALVVPRTAPADIIANAKPLDNVDAADNIILSNLELVDIQYKRLKQLDQDYARKIVDSANPVELNSLNSNISEAEKNLKTKIENLEILAKVYTDQKTSSLLRSFAESYRLVMNDRASMQAFKKGISPQNDTNNARPGMLTVQNEIQARDSRIAALEDYINLLGNKGMASISIANKIVANQQNIDELRLTINEQEKKIANLTAANTALVKDSQTNVEALDQVKKGTDNSSVTLRNQNTALEKMVNELSVEVSLAQVDCNLTRADAGQIISNSRQRKVLLSDALSTLKNLSINGDAGIKMKVQDKLNRLNQIAATVHD